MLPPRLGYGHVARMAKRQSNGTIGDLVDLMGAIFQHVPPWLSLPLAAGAYFGMTTGLNRQMTGGQHSEIISLMGGIAAVAILAGGAIGWRRRREKAALLKQDVTMDWVNSLSWREFETLTGELFRAQGYTVELTGGGGADGGIDLRLRRGGEVALAQCKRWKVYKVGVKPVREFYGVMAAEGADHGLFVNSGVYTQEALEFAQGKPLRLIDGAQLVELVRSFQERGLAKSDSAPPKDPTPDTPACPLCGKPMVLRRAKTGRTAGQAFHGCPAFPQCRGTRALD